MSVITGPGFYRQRNGKKAEVFGQSVSDGYWYGRSSCGAPESWPSTGVFLHDTNQRECQFDITGRWIDEPDPGEGWRLLKGDERVQFGDEMNSKRNRCCAVGWLDARHHVGELAWNAHLDFRRRIEEWNPTCELRWCKSADANIGSVEYVKTDVGRWNFADLEQKWTCGDKSEWRPVEVQQ